MSDRIIARVTAAGGGNFQYGYENGSGIGMRYWDVTPFAEGKGFIVRPHPNAGGGAHPRYLSQTGFLSVSPSWGAKNPDEVLTEGKIVSLEWRETKKGEKFVAVLPPPAQATPFSPTHLLILANWAPPQEEAGNEGIEFAFAQTAFIGEDRTASGKDYAVEAALLVPVGQEVWHENTPYQATIAGLIPGVANGISADDNLN